MQIGPAANARNAPDRTAVVFEDTRTTWGEWNARVIRLAHALRALGPQRNPSGKLLKREIRARYREGRERRV